MEFDDDYKSIFSFLLRNKDVRSDSEALESIKTKLETLDQAHLKELLTFITDEHSPLCLARDAPSISILLKSITSKSDRLTLLLKPDQSAPNSICDAHSQTIFMEQSFGLKENSDSTTKINFIKKILGCLEQTAHSIFLGQTDRDGNNIIHHLLRISRPSDEEDSQWIYVAIEGILRCLELSDLLKALLNGSAKPPIHCIYRDHHMDHEHSRRLFQVVYSCIDKYSSRISLLKVIDITWHGRSFFWRVLSRGDDDTRLSILRELDHNDLMNLLMMNDDNDVTVLFVSRESCRIVLKFCSVRESNSEETIQLLKIQDRITGSTFLHELLLNFRESNNPSDQIISDLMMVAKDMDKRELLNLFITPNWKGITPFILSLRKPSVLRWVIQTIDRQDMMDMVESGNILHSLSQSPNAAATVLSALSDTQRVRLLRAKDAMGDTPLHKSNSLQNIKLLLGVLPSRDYNLLKILLTKNLHGDTPLHGHVIDPDKFCEIVTADEALEILSIRNNAGNTIIHEETPQNIVKIIDIMKVDAPQAVLGIQNLCDCTVFHNIARPKEGISAVPDIYPLLCCIAEVEERNKVLAMKDTHGDTVLHILLSDDSRSSALVQLMKDLNDIQGWCRLMVIPNKRGDTPIHLMVSRYHIFQAVIRYIPVEKRFDILKNQNNDGSTPLHLAVSKSNLSKTTHCILCQLNPEERLALMALRDSHGLTAFEIAVSRDNIACKQHMCSLLGVAALFESHKLSNLDYKHLIATVAAGNQESVRTCLNNIDAHGRCLILELFNPEVEQQWLKDIVDELNGIHCAAIEKAISDSTPQKLRSKETDFLSCRFDNGGSILHMLARRNDSDRLLKLLNSLDSKQREELISSKDNSGKTALDVANSYSIRHILEWSFSQEGFYYLQTPPAVLLLYSTDERETAEQEMLELRRVLPQFNVDVIERKNPNKQQIFDAIRVAQLGTQISALVVFIMSHGTKGYVCASDGNISIRDILLQMCVPDLEGKPKVLVVQACQTNVITQSSAPAGADPSPPCAQMRAHPLALATADHQEEDKPDIDFKERDVCLIMATVSGDYAYGNLMIPILARELRSSNDGDIYEAFLKTHAKMRDRLNATPGQDQIPKYHSTLEHKLCLQKIFKSV